MSIKKILKNYYRFLKNLTAVFELLDDWYEIRTPLLDMFNDAINIYIKKTKDKIILSDDGTTIMNFNLIGIDALNHRQTKFYLDRALLTYGIKIKNKELTLEADRSDIDTKLYHFMNAIIEMNGLGIFIMNDIKLLQKEEIEKIK